MPQTLDLIEYRSVSLVHDKSFCSLHLLSAPAPVMFLFMRGIHGSCWLFISHCFQAWTALFIFVSWVSADGTGTPPSTSWDSPSDKDIFFFPPPSSWSSRLMKTKYAHLPLLSYPTLLLLSPYFILPFRLPWHPGQWELCLCPAVVRKDSQ